MVFFSLFETPVQSPLEHRPAYLHCYQEVAVREPGKTTMIQSFLNQTQIEFVLGKVSCGVPQDH